jgi:hypothetical protein
MLDVGDKSSVGSEGLRHENRCNGFFARAERACIVHSGDRGSSGKIRVGEESAARGGGGGSLSRWAWR